MSDNSVIQLTLNVHLVLLGLLAGAHRLGWDGLYSQAGFRAATAIYSGVFVAQLALIGLWAAWSRSSSALRVGAIVLLVPLLAAVQSQVFSRTYVIAWFAASPHDDRIRYLTWVMESLAFAGHVTLVGLILRIGGVRVARDSQSLADPWRWQFGFRNLVEWSFVLALFLAAVNWLREYGWTKGHLRVAVEWFRLEYFAHLDFLLLSLAIAAGLLWFQQRRWGLVAMLAGPLVLSLLGEILRLRVKWLYPHEFAESPPVDQYLNYSHPDLAALLFFAFAAVFGGTMLVVRSLGYRLTWQKPWALPPVAEST